MLKNIIVLLNKPKERRNDKDIEKILTPMLSNLKFFKEKVENISKRDFNEISLSLKYEYFSAGEKVFNQGDFGPEKSDKFYMIMRG